MLNETITIYAIIDGLLKAIGHHEDIRCQMSNAEIITTTLVAAIFFHGNHSEVYTDSAYYDYSAEDYWQPGVVKDYWEYVAVESWERKSCR